MWKYFWVSSRCYCLFLFLSITFLEIFVRPKLQNLLEQIAIELRKSRKLFKCQRRRRRTRRDRILRPLRLLLASVGPIPTESSTRRRYSLPASREPRASTERTEINDPLGAKASERQRGSSATLEAGGWCESRRCWSEKPQPSNWKRGRAIGRIRSPWCSSTFSGISPLWRSASLFWSSAATNGPMCRWEFGWLVTVFSAGFTWHASASSTGGGGVGEGETRAMDRQLLRLLLPRSSTFR